MPDKAAVVDVLVTVGEEKIEEEDAAAAPTDEEATEDAVEPGGVGRSTSQGRVYCALAAALLPTPPTPAGPPLPPGWPPPPLLIGSAKGSHADASPPNSRLRLKPSPKESKSPMEGRPVVGSRLDACPVCVVPVVPVGAWWCPPAW